MFFFFFLLFHNLNSNKKKVKALSSILGFNVLFFMESAVGNESGPRRGKIVKVGGNILNIRDLHYKRSAEFTELVLKVVSWGYSQRI